ncbi:MULTISPECIES: hypothetical protein [unclassified Clostridioides]|uniref:hypothetical protein n=1 Tax=unclassified Clostridioides TaxID=2635829 RepID=UPI001D12D00A|nr:hypothetical protein [Clostridioides sp. ES-S-0049-03]MCC0657326.1 hypothetical protein [Clostridioides sp. ES-S-0123-01]MCC0672731.1 hypothetical protein [Clostridioides sp. ES-S-0145-01]MCC0675337.1 hypothetical protein [Clostridioides sp. ES-W-0018-02]MCC0679953.1 hypothetical protein [Clostridioides sp. ES-S-0005-03]MCC0709854.1 hypothetical protein [Clostridioides sp. ES-W-0017-02]UDN46188.1 hypothetical protein JJJ25_11545 [Clostridioides sp. ES-S-0173-01]UDN59836.1 hypothetical pro
MYDNINSLSKIYTENTITFSRIKNLKCISYKLYVNEKIGERWQSYLLAEIPNPKVEVLLNENKVLEYNSNQKWDVSKAISGTVSKSIKVSVNNIELNNRNYTFNSKFKILYIHIELSPTDFVEIQYQVDKIKYVHKTLNKCEYSVVPVFDKQYLTGQHSLL